MVLSHQAVSFADERIHHPKTTCRRFPDSRSYGSDKKLLGSSGAGAEFWEWLPPRDFFQFSMPKILGVFHSLLWPLNYEAPPIRKNRLCQVVGCPV
jgi:hypothetical protein